MLNPVEALFLSIASINAVGAIMLVGFNASIVSKDQAIFNYARFKKWLNENSNKIHALTQGQATLVLDNCHKIDAGLKGFTLTLPKSYKLLPFAMNRSKLRDISMTWPEDARLAKDLPRYAPIKRFRKLMKPLLNNTRLPARVNQTAEVLDTFIYGIDCILSYRYSWKNIRLTTGTSFLAYFSILLLILITVSIIAPRL